MTEVFQMEKYEELKMEVIEFSDADVILTSGDSDDPITGPEL
jgi:hypothetical protein